MYALRSRKVFCLSARTLLPGGKFNGIIGVRNSQGQFETSFRTHDAYSPTLPAPYGGQYFVITGWGGGAFERHAKAMPEGQHRVVARLEVGLHGQVGGS